MSRDVRREANIWIIVHSEEKVHDKQLTEKPLMALREKSCLQEGQHGDDTFGCCCSLDVTLATSLKHEQQPPYIIVSPRDCHKPVSNA